MSEPVPHTDHAIVDHNFNGVRFPIQTADGSIVPVHVLSAAIDVMTPGTEDEDDLARFSGVAGIFGDLATEKLVRGDRAPDGTVVITADDAALGDD